MLFTNSSSHCVQWKCLQKQHTTELQFHYLDIVRKNDGKKNLLMKVERRNENGNNIKKTSSELMWTMTYNNSMEFILCRKMKWHQKKTRNSEWLKKYTEQASERRKKRELRNVRFCVCALWDVDMQRAKSTIKLAMGMTRCQHSYIQNGNGTVRREKKKFTQFHPQSSQYHPYCVPYKQANTQ